tara:strand:- start:17 stop:367 length:351 start_codon:yes stop_codon:yes gene_type:complete
MKISEIIDSYIKNQEKIDNTNEKLKILKENNKKLSETILHFMENNNKNELSYRNSSFEKKNNKTHSVISQKLLKESLTKYFETHNSSNIKIDELIGYILNSRSINSKTELKYKNTN